MVFGSRCELREALHPLVKGGDWEKLPILLRKIPSSLSCGCRESGNRPESPRP
jgi:hypothetical protein